MYNLICFMHVTVFMVCDDNIKKLQSKLNLKIKKYKIEILLTYLRVEKNVSTYKKT